MGSVRGNTRFNEHDRCRLPRAKAHHPQDDLDLALDALWNAATSRCDARTRRAIAGVERALDAVTRAIVKDGMIAAGESDPLRRAYELTAADAVGTSGAVARYNAALFANELS